MPPDSTPPPVTQASSTPPISISSHSERTRRVVIAVGLVILCLIILAFIPFNGRSFVERVSAAHALSGIYVSQGNDTTKGVFAFGIFGLKPYAVPGATGATDDFAQGGHAVVAVVRGTNSSTVEELSPKQQTLSHESGTKALVAVSPDGAWAAYSVATTPAPFPSYISAWQTELVSLTGSTTLSLGTGIGPQFFERDGTLWLLYTNPNGLTVFNVAKRTSFMTPFNFRNSISFMAKISPDGQYAALRDAATSRFSIFKVKVASDVLPLSTSPLTLPNDIHAADDVSLTNSGVITSTFSGKQVTIASLPYSAANGRVLYQFAGSGPYRLMP